MLVVLPKHNPEEKQPNLNHELLGLTQTGLVGWVELPLPLLTGCTHCTSVLGWTQDQNSLSSYYLAKIYTLHFIGQILRATKERGSN